MFSEYEFKEGEQETEGGWCYAVLVTSSLTSTISKETIYTSI